MRSIAALASALAAALSWSFLAAPQLASGWGEAERSRSPASQVTLRYRGEPGQAAVYRLLLHARGEQTSLSEARPINVQAEYELREVVVATGPGAAFTVRISPRTIDLRDPTGVSATAEHNRLPELELLVTPQGAVLQVRPAPEDHFSLHQRAFASLMAQSGFILLPDAPVSPGQAWQREDGGRRQNSTLVSLAKEGWGSVARIASTATAPVQITEENAPLGLSIVLRGSTSETSRMELLVEQGLVRRHRGTVRTEAGGEVTLNLPGGVKRFPTQARMRVDFDLRLVSVENTLAGS